MIRIAFVDDDEQYLSDAQKYVALYAEESGEKFQITTFLTGMDFITDYRPVYDIVFLDIEMPLMDGMSIAKNLRKLDDKICIVFITRMHQYAVEGYEVNAVDFIVKPIKQANFIDKLKKAIAVSRTLKETEIFIKTDDGFVRVPVSKIYYVEKDKNYLLYRTEMGEYRERGTLDGAEQNLKDCGFSRCNSGCLANLRNVQRLSPCEVVINGISLPISRSRMKAIKSDLFAWLKKGG